MAEACGRGNERIDGDDAVSRSTEPGSSRPGQSTEKKFYPWGRWRSAIIGGGVLGSLLGLGHHSASSIGGATQPHRPSARPGMRKLAASWRMRPLESRSKERTTAGENGRPAREAVATTHRRVRLKFSNEMPRTPLKSNCLMPRWWHNSRGLRFHILPRLTLLMTMTVRQFVESLSSRTCSSAGELSSIRSTITPEQEATAADDFVRKLVRKGSSRSFKRSICFKVAPKVWCLASYIVLDKLGARRQWGKCFKAQHRRMKTWVALKVLPPHAVSSQKSINRFYQEVESPRS